MAAAFDVLLPQLGQTGLVSISMSNGKLGGRCRKYDINRTFLQTHPAILPYNVGIRHSINSLNLILNIQGAWYCG